MSYDKKVKEEIPMNWWKIILFAIVVVFGLYLGFALIGFLYSILWYLLVIGVLGLGGFVGYKYLTKGKQKEIEGVNTVSQLELDNAKIVRELEELKRKINR